LADVECSNWGYYTLCMYVCITQCHDIWTVNVYNDFNTKHNHYTWSTNNALL